MKILGLSYGYHDSAASLCVDGVIVAAAQEERFVRSKHFSGFPKNAINYCLQNAECTINEIDFIVFYEQPYKKFHRIFESHLKAWPCSWKLFLTTMPHWIGERLVTPLHIKNELGYQGPIVSLPHHLSHASSAFFSSSFLEAAYIVSDGVGEWASLTWGEGRGNTLFPRQELHFPHSMGLVYSALTAFLGFGANSGEGKTMGLADWGKPSYIDQFRKMIPQNELGEFSIDEKFFDFSSGERMYTKKFIRLFGQPRLPHEELTDRHRDLAASLQLRTEEVLCKIAKNVQKKTGMKNLVLSGGSFLNLPTVDRILKETSFENVFIQPAAGDAGASLGGALYFYYHHLKNERNFHMTHAALGPQFSKHEIETYLKSMHAPFVFMEDHDLAEFVAEKIEAGKIVGLLNGRMEFGPRALGNRSILASPSYSEMKDTLNAKVKHRQSFRPYGVAILKECTHHFFDVEKDFESPFMLRIANVKKEKAASIPSALHINQTSRLQTVTEADGIYYKIINAFYKRTQVPMVINTSFNDNTEPIVLSYRDAYRCFTKTHMDYLVLENYVVQKNS